MRDLLVGGPNLAAQALAAGLVDELPLFVWPVVLGGRKPALPTDTRADLELLDEHRFGNGVVHLRYRVHELARGRLLTERRRLWVVRAPATALHCCGDAWSLGLVENAE